MLRTKEGILIGYYNYDQDSLDTRTGSLLMLCDVQRGGIIEIYSKKYPLINLGEFFSELEKLCQQQELTLATIKPIAEKYGL